MKQHAVCAFLGKCDFAVYIFLKMPLSKTVRNAREVITIIDLSECNVSYIIFLNSA